MLARMMTLPIWAHAGATVAALGVFQWVKGRLDASYAVSGHPVDYATGQLAFDADTIEGYYLAMQSNGGLDVYWTTQTIDFAFIASVMAVGLTLGTLVARLGRPGSWGRKLGLVAVGFAVAGAGMDAVENLLSFVMLLDPAQIMQPLAVIYSGSAAAKFALLTLAMAAVVLSLVCGALSRLRKA